MQYHFFNISAIDSATGAQNFNEFCNQNRVVTIDKQLVIDGQSSFWAICVSTMPVTKLDAAKRKPPVDYKEVLTPSDFTIFAQLRLLRKTMAENEGVPAYALFTNEQLAKMVTERITSANELLAIEGIGKARVDKYAPAFLEVLITAINNEAGQN